MSAALFVEAAVRSGILLGVVLLLCGLRPRSAPALRHAALTVALLAVGVMPLLSLLLPAWHLDLPGTADGVLGSATRLVAGSPEAGAERFAQSPVVGRAPWVILGVWAGGALLLLGRIGGGLRGIARLRRAACDGGLTYRVGRRVRVVLSHAVPAPAVVGLVRPTILIPAAAAGWPAAERRAVLLHELAHVRRGDAWTLLLAWLVRAVYWPNPLVWLAARRLRRASEEACDAAVVAAGVKPVAYAGLLVRLARGSSDAAVPALAQGAAEPGGLSARVHALLRGGHRSPARGRLVALVGALAALVIGLAVVQRDAADTLAAEWAGRFGIDEELAGSILRAAEAEGVDPGVAFGLVSVESGFDPQRTSRAGAIGLTQILPSTAAMLRPGSTPEAILSPETNLRLGFMLLGRYRARFAGDMERALLAYHIGPRNVERGRHGAGADYPARVLRAAGGPVPVD